MSADHFFHEESERSILAGIIIENSLINETFERGLTPEQFYSPKHKILFAEMQKLFKQRKPIDLVTLSASLKESAKYEEIGGDSFLTQIYEDNFHSGHMTAYIETIQKKATLRKLMVLGRQISADSGTASDPDLLIESIQAKLCNLQTDGKHLKLTLVPDAYSSALIDVLDKNVQKGLPTGFTGIDKVLNGLMAGNLIIVAARPAMGKTAFVISLLANLYRQSEPSTLFFSLEMTEAEIMHRLMANMAEVNTVSMRSRNFSIGDLYRLQKVLNDNLIGHRNAMCDSSGLSVSKIRSLCMRHLSKKKKLDLVVVDYLQLVVSENKGKGAIREQQVAEMSSQLKSLAKELQIPVIALAQLNRGLEMREDKRPKLSDLRESGSLEQDADIVAFLYRDEVYNKETSVKGLAEFIVAKNRHGATGTAILKWVPQFVSFENFDGEKNDKQK